MSQLAVGSGRGRPRVDLLPADRPTMYFIGVTATASSINRVFPLWLPILGIADAELIGIDIPLGSDPVVLRDVVSFIGSDHLSHGALVTTHKIDVHVACADLFDEVDASAEALGEVSCIWKRDGKLIGSALDVATSGSAAKAFVPRGHWARSKAEVLLLGAGGAATALMCYLLDPAHGLDRPRRITATSRRLERLERIRGVHDRQGFDVKLDLHQAMDPGINDAAAERLPDGSLVVNATGLGKDAPGSPLSDSASFPRQGLAWDFNYRGQLVFLDQARSQAKERGLVVEDGWSYFIHGWSRHIARVFGLDASVIRSEVDRLSAVAEQVR